MTEDSATYTKRASAALEGSSGAQPGSAQWERELRERALEDEEAFTALLRYYQPHVLRLVSRWVRRREEAMELTQDTFLHAFRSRERYDSARPFRSWLFQIAVNLTRNYIRAASRREAAWGSEPGERGLWASGHQASDEVLARQQERALVERALAQVSDDDRALLLLRYTEELSYEELEQIYGKSSNVLKMRVHRALKRLRAAAEEMLQ